MFIELVMPSNHLILCCPLLLLPSIFPSNRVFSNESALRIRWPKYWSFSFSISPSNEYSGLFPLGWTVLISLLSKRLKHHNIKASILLWSVFFVMQLTSVRNYWKNHTFDYTDLCWQSGISHHTKGLSKKRCLLLSRKLAQDQERRWTSEEEMRSECSEAESGGLRRRDEITMELHLVVVGVQSKSCPTLRDPEDCSMPGFHVPHHLLEHAQVQVHWIGDAIQPSHPLSPSSSAFNLS